MLHLFQQIWERTGLTARRCPVCGVLCGKTNNGLCSACSEALRPRTGGYCPTCGDIYAEEGTPPMECGECRTSPPPWRKLAFHSVHAGLLRDLILGYKFHNGLGKAKLLADFAHEAYRRVSNDIPDAIIPVPLHRKRLLWRGYNQSTELSRTLARSLGCPILSEALIRTRHTAPQTSLDASERETNIMMAFEAAPNLVKGKTLLLVDDVYTTGATLRECAKTLRQAGAAGVDVVCLSRAIG